MTPKCIELQFLSLPTPNDTKNILMSQLWVDTLQHFPLWFVQHLKSDSTDVQWYRRLQTEKCSGREAAKLPRNAVLSSRWGTQKPDWLSLYFLLFISPQMASRSSFSPWTGLLSCASGISFFFFLFFFLSSWFLYKMSKLFIKAVRCYIVY